MAAVTTITGIAFMRVGKGGDYILNDTAILTKTDRKAQTFRACGNFFF